MLCGLITDLFVDYFKFQGRNVSTQLTGLGCSCLPLTLLATQVQSRIPDLMRILQDYDFDRVVRFFQEA